MKLIYKLDLLAFVIMVALFTYLFLCSLPLKIALGIALVIGLLRVESYFAGWTEQKENADILRTMVLKLLDRNHDLMDENNAYRKSLSK